MDNEHRMSISIFPLDKPNCPMPLQSHFSTDAYPVLKTRTAQSRAMLSIPMQKSHSIFSFTFKTAFRLLFWFLCKRKKRKVRSKKFLHQIASYPLMRRAECSFLFLHTAHGSGPSPAVSPASPERICRQLQHRERGVGEHRPQRRNNPAPAYTKTPPLTQAALW